MRRAPRVYDPAVQLERTQLAWVRTAVAVGANGALVMRAGLSHNAIAMVVCGTAVLGLAGTLWVLPSQRYAALAGRRVGQLLGLRLHIMVGVATFCALLSVLALAAVLISEQG